TGLLKTAVKLIGEALVGSAWPAALSIVTVGAVVSLITVKLLELLAEPPGVMTLIGPLEAPAGTVAWIAVAELTVRTALVAPNCTAVVPVKLVPLIVTLVPAGPLTGVKLVIVGELGTVKLLALLAVPPGVMTLMGPLEAPAGTVAWIAVAELTVKLAPVAPNCTDVGRATSVLL